ncbi:hypothetical protein [Allomuricauda sp. NBRC 101325]|nr:hypothetical protein [Muricauda sp. NBRC 101325]
MTTLETINTLQVTSLVIIAFIIYMIGWLHGAHWSNKNRTEH